EGGARPRLSVDLLELPVEIRTQVGESTAGRFYPQLCLHELVEHAIDRSDADAVTVAGRYCDLIDALGDIARRLGIRHVAGDDRQTGLSDLQSRQRIGNCLSEAHGVSRLTSAASSSEMSLSQHGKQILDHLVAGRNDLGVRRISLLRND